MRIGYTLGLGLALLPTAALGHAGAGWIGPNEVWHAWTLDPLVLVPMALGWWLYGRGMAREPRFRDSRAVAFAAGMALLALGLVWPLDAMGETLFSAHMAQHMVLTVFAPPLLLLGRPAGPVLVALPIRLRRTMAIAARKLRRWIEPLLGPTTASLLHGAAVWAWHAPVAFDAALADEWVHRAEHASFFLTGLLFWAMVLRAVRARDRMAAPAAAGALLFTLMHSGLLGCLIAFAPEPLYAYGIRPTAWGISPLTDQQLAGLVMWVPAGFAYIGAGVGLLALWLNRMTPAEHHVPGGAFHKG
ncbi:cytochrome c oxidase assembly protein [Indioceanicola profundi]|uniref:cytochrome c oxidase assembly protein n=1 Tax=Indioceanicola profundi TaxID=2220096 RepID=UPI000E6ACF62|nr:cytochrome c oxidase assembly protein [Indioceanicola profundi]